MSIYPSDEHQDSSLAQGVLLSQNANMEDDRAARQCELERQKKDEDLMMLWREYSRIEIEKMAEYSPHIKTIQEWGDEVSDVIAQENRRKFLHILESDFFKESSSDEEMMSNILGEFSIDEDGDLIFYDNIEIDDRKCYRFATQEEALKTLGNFYHFALASIRDIMIKEIDIDVSMEYIEKIIKAIPHEDRSLIAHRYLLPVKQYEDHEEPESEPRRESLMEAFFKWSNLSYDLAILFLEEGIFKFSDFFDKYDKLEDEEIVDFLNILKRDSQSYKGEFVDAGFVVSEVSQLSSQKRQL